MLHFWQHALVRAPKALAAALPEETRKHLADALRSTRKIPAYNSNWLFFSAMVEAGLYVIGEPYDIMRVIYPMRVFSSGIRVMVFTAMERCSIGTIIIVL